LFSEEAGSSLGSLQCVNVASIADISEARAAPS
jgi:hypothetical protein